MRTTEFELSLSHPYDSHNPAQRVSIQITEESSRQTVFSVELTAEHFVQLLASRVLTGVRAATTSHPERLGRDLETHVVTLGRCTEVAAETARLLAMTGGWHQVTKRENRGGWQLTCRRWVAVTDAE